MPVLLSLQCQVIAGVQPEVGRELEVVGVGGVVGFLGLPPALRTEGIDRIGAAFHGLPVAVHKGKACRKAVGGLVSLDQFVFSRDVQHMATVELEGERLAEVQGGEHPVRLGQRVGQLSREAFGFQAREELQAVGLTLAAFQVALPLSPTGAEEGGGVGIEHQVLHILVESADGYGDGTALEFETGPGLVHRLRPVLPGGRDEHLQGPAGGETFQRMEELHPVVQGRLQGKGRGQFIGDQQVGGRTDRLVIPREEDGCPEAGGAVERPLVIMDLPMHGSAESYEGVARAGGKRPFVVHFGNARLEDRQEQIPAGLAFKSGRQRLGGFHLHPLLDDGGLDRRPGLDPVGTPRFVLEGAETIVGDLRFPVPSGIAVLDPGHVHDQVAPSQRPGCSLAHIVSIPVITAEDR